MNPQDMSDSLKYSFFIKENDFNKFTSYKEFPIWGKTDLPQEIVQVNSYARLNVIRGAFLFRAYNEKDEIIYEETFNEKNQQTLLKPNIRHSVKSIGEDIQCQLQLYK